MKLGFLFILSGKRVSNPRPAAWEAAALPTELLPQSLSSPLKSGGKSTTFLRMLNNYVPNFPYETFFHINLK